ncbi:MAG: hypothetical protein R8M45_03360 [Ghiorsea sp.]
MGSKGFNNIAEVVGYEHAMKIIETFGGMAVYISKGGAFRHECVALIGEVGWSMLFRAYRQEILEIPMDTARQRAARNERVIQDWQRGKTERELVMKYNMTGRNIRNIKSKYRSMNHEQGTQEAPRKHRGV